MSETTTTPFSNKCQILADLWMSYRDDEAFTELLKYGDLGFPLSYAIHENIVKSSPLAEQYINEIWDLLLGELGIDEDTGFDSIEDVFDTAP